MHDPVSTKYEYMDAKRRDPPPPINVCLGGPERAKMKNFKLGESIVRNRYRSGNLPPNPSPEMKAGRSGGLRDGGRTYVCLSNSRSLAGGSFH